jgi:hypothetical protein
MSISIYILSDTFRSEFKKKNNYLYLYPYACDHMRCEMTPYASDHMRCEMTLCVVR